MSIILQSAEAPDRANPFLILPGIRELPSDMFGWTDRASRYLRLEHGIDAEKLEYYLWAVRLPGKLRDLSRNFAAVIRYYNRKGIVPNVIAHSNGNVIVCRTLRRYPDIRIGTLFMVMPACWSSCADNGLNVALLQDRVQAVRFFGSRKDNVVRWGGGLTGWLRFLDLGYGTASFDGLTEIDAAVADRIVQVDMTPWGHGTFAGPRTLPNFLDHLVIPHAEYS